MVSERDREIWDDATNAVCQAMQEQKMCNCPDGDCLAAKINFSPEKIATATRPAPAATDTGLETVETQWRCAFIPNDKWVNSKQPENMRDGDIETRELVTRSQAEELLAAKEAERAEQWRLRREMEADRDTQKAIAASLEADNAAQAAQLSEVENSLFDAKDIARNASSNCMYWRGQTEALEAKLAAAEKALEQLRSDCQTPIDMYERNGPEFTSPHGNEYESTSYVMAKFAELVASIDEARAVLGGKPS